LSLVDKDGVPHVAMRPIVEGIGLNWASQYVKLAKENKKFSCCDIATTGSDGKQYEMLCIPLEMLEGWLYSVNANKIPDLTARGRVELYQRECSKALHQYWQNGIAVRPGAAVTSTDPMIAVWQSFISAREEQLKLDARQSKLESKFEAAQAETKADIQQLKCEVNHHDTMCSIVGWCKLTGREWMGNAAAARIGKKLVALTEAAGLTVGTVNDAKYGRINTYPHVILEEHLDRLCDQMAAEDAARRGEAIG
jgi:hypothetical protein